LGAAATLEALSRGASDFFAKPGGAGGLEASRKIIRSELIPAIRALCPRKSRVVAASAPAKPPLPRPASATSRVDLVAIGASTGGPNALADVFAALPADFPVPIVVVQHMPPKFTQMLAERLTKNSKIPTVEARSGLGLEPGKAWIAPGDHHLVVAREGVGVRTRVHQEPPENSCRPAVDPLLRSVANLYGPNSLAVILTGMGQDGLRGSEAIRAAGGQVLVQDEATSVVWGMPGYVARAGLADKVLPLNLLAGEILRRVRVGRE
jgi:two-component system, chemotaxis family, protein-glutamate methylesterase/glutaminase